MHNQPSGAAYDVVLLLHVACVVVGIVTIATAAATARRLDRLARTAAPLPEPVRRYFRPGVNWAGRTIYGIPVFGFALLGLSHGAYAVTDGWVLSGLVLFVAFVLSAAAWGVLRLGRRRPKTLFTDFGDARRLFAGGMAAHSINNKVDAAFVVREQLVFVVLAN